MACKAVLGAFSPLFYDSLSVTSRMSIELSSIRSKNTAYFTFSMRDRIVLNSSPMRR